MKIQKRADAIFSFQKNPWDGVDVGWNILCPPCVRPFATDGYWNSSNGYNTSSAMDLKLWSSERGVAVLHLITSYASWLAYQNYPLRIKWSSFSLGLRMTGHALTCLKSVGETRIKYHTAPCYGAAVDQWDWSQCWIFLADCRDHIRSRLITWKDYWILSTFKQLYTKIFVIEFCFHHIIKINQEHRLYH